MKTQRLLKLADFLSKLSKRREKKFDMGTWFSIKTDLEINVPKEIKTEEDINHCGFSACAIGWACTIPEFRRAGLKLKAGPWGHFFPHFKHNQNLYAVKAFFGLDVETAESLFMPDFYYGVDHVTPGMVARRIKSVVRKHQAA